MAKTNLLLKLATLFVILMSFSLSSRSQELDLPTPEATDTCPVCGMFVAKYPEWITTVLYNNGHTHHFDGAKDLFKYLQDMPKWAGEHNAEDIQTVGVTEYYGLTLIDAKNAWYVIGSDVLGPMGHELIPLASEEDASEFMVDHKGQRITTFSEIKMNLLTNLDNGKFQD